MADGCQANAQVCTACNEGFFVVNGTCVSCDVTNCETCNTTNFCTVCVSGFQALNGSCIECDI